MSFVYGTSAIYPEFNSSKESAREEGVLPYMGYIGMCRCEGYGFHAVNSRIFFSCHNPYVGIGPVNSRIGYINQNVWVKNMVSFSRN